MTATYQTTRTVRNTGINGWLAGVELLSPRTHLPVAHYFGGVRYAQAPVGELRFRKTRPLPADFSYGSEQYPADCSKSSNLCPQPDWRSVLEPSDRQRWNEDCVQANIWIPVAEEPPAPGWPVLFHIHGGFLQFGEPNKSMDVIANLYEETSFRAIVVMPAYRLNMFGFLASKELEAEARAEDEHAGNMGFWDQRTALEWTARIIRAFNGDASNITVSGYSAGKPSTPGPLRLTCLLCRSSLRLPSALTRPLSTSKRVTDRSRYNVVERLRRSAQDLDTATALLRPTP
jgi:carboxylesterase type B